MNAQLFLVFLSPLGLLAALESLQYAHDLLEGSQVCPQLGSDLSLIGTQLGVEVFAVRAGAHGSGEYGLDKDTVVRLEGRAVCVSEGGGEFFGFLGNVLAQRNAGKVQTPGEAVN